MRWGEGRRSDNVEDRLGIRVSRGMVGGGARRGYFFPGKGSSFSQNAGRDLPPTHLMSMIP